MTKIPGIMPTGMRWRMGLVNRTRKKCLIMRVNQTTATIAVVMTMTARMRKKSSMQWAVMREKNIID